MAKKHDKKDEAPVDSQDYEEEEEDPFISEDEEISEEELEEEIDMAFE